MKDITNYTLFNPFFAFQEKGRSSSSLDSEDELIMFICW